MRLQLDNGKGALVTGRVTRPALPARQSRLGAPPTRGVRSAALRSLVALSVGIVVACSIFVPTVSADEVTGTWTGSLEGRGNYYYERSTRVIVPAVKARLTAPNGIRVGADYLVDVISSASIASGVEEDEVFTELRHGVGVEVGKEFDLGGAQLDLGLHGTYSTEDDYKSYIYGLRAALALDDKNTTLRLTAARVQDEIRRNRDPTFEEELDGLTLGAGIEQVINPTMLISVGYQFGYLEGFLANAYRMVPPLFEERHPDERFRHTASARLSWLVPATDTAFHLMYSAYADNWDIAALNPELRIYQHFGQNVIVRPRYRFYTQTKAWFQLMPYPPDWDGPVTGDPKMTEFHTHTLGVSLEYRLSWLGGTVFDFARNTWLDISIDRYWSTNAYGNGVIATAGGRLEF
jgi:opacity protein-like surface antigen